MSYSIRAQVLVGAVCLGLVGTATGQTLQEPGYSESLVGAVPGIFLVSASGSVADDMAGNHYVTVTSSRDIYSQSLGGNFSTLAMLPLGYEANALYLDGDLLYIGGWNPLASTGHVFMVDLSMPASAPILLTGATPLSDEPRDMLMGCGGFAGLVISTRSGTWSMDTESFVATRLGGAEDYSSLTCKHSGVGLLAAFHQQDTLYQVAAAVPFGPAVFRAGVGDGPDGIAVHRGTGDVFVSLGNADKIVKIAGGTGAATDFLTGIDLEGGAKSSGLRFSADGARLYYVQLSGISHQIRAISGFPAYMTGTILSPTPGATVEGDITIELDVDHPDALPTVFTFEYSVDGGASYALCTAAECSSTTNPGAPVGTPALSYRFIWNSLADTLGFAAPQDTWLRMSASDGVQTAMQTMQVVVDNDVRGEMATPACSTTNDGDVTVDFYADDRDGDLVTMTFEYSLDGGVSYNLCTASPVSPHANPSAVGTPALAQRFIWNSLADTLGLVTAQPLDLRMTMSDGSHTRFQHRDLAIDNSGSCFATCGDCNRDNSQPNILDSLRAAQFAVSLGIPSPSQAGCCDVNVSGTIDILDSLQIAQEAAGLDVNLSCF